MNAVSADTSWVASKTELGQPAGPLDRSLRFPRQDESFLHALLGTDPTRRRCSRILTLLLAIVIGVLALSGHRKTSAAEVTALKIETQAFKGDWETILARGTIRVAVPYSRTLFFNDRGTQMGLTAARFTNFNGG